MQSMRETCTKELVLKSFSATGVLPFDSNKIDLEQFPASLAHATPVPESLVQATCSTCRKNNVELHPLVKQGCIPKKLADVFTYSVAPGKARSRVKTVECARIITSEEIRQEVRETEERKRQKGKGKEKATVARIKKKVTKTTKTASKCSAKKSEATDDSESDPEIYFAQKRKQRN